MFTYIGKVLDKKQDEYMQDELDKHWNEVINKLLNKVNYESINHIPLDKRIIEIEEEFDEITI
jgi:hypothetical protein